MVVSVRFAIKSVNLVDVVSVEKHIHFHVLMKLNLLQVVKDGRHIYGENVKNVKINARGRGKGDTPFL